LFIYLTTKRTGKIYIAFVYLLTQWRTLTGMVTVCFMTDR